MSGPICDGCTQPKEQCECNPWGPDMFDYPSMPPHNILAYREVYISPIHKIASDTIGTIVFIDGRDAYGGLMFEATYRPTTASLGRLERLLRRYTPHRIDMVPTLAITYRFPVQVER
jgi:hypothetical protein